MEKIQGEFKASKTHMRWTCHSRLMLLCALILCFVSWQARAGTVTTVASIADLKLLSTSGLANGTVAYVIDYHGLSSSPPRGGGHFCWVKPRPSPSVDDGGRWIECTADTTSGVWERVLDGGVANVKMWGAFGDGSTDDTTYIKNAIAGCEGWQANGDSVHELLFPAATYVVTDTLVFNGTLLHIRGESPLSAIVQMSLGVNKDIFRTGNANDWINGVGDGSSYDHGLLFENMKLVFASDGADNGHPARNTANAGLVVGLTGEVSTIRNVTVHNGGIGIRCLGAGAPGLSLRDINTSEQAIAGVQIENLPGAAVITDGGPITIIGLSGDQNDGGVAANSSLLVISNIASLVSIQSVKAEADWGGGLIHYYCGANGSGQEHLVLRECNYNAGNNDEGQFHNPPFLKIDSSPWFSIGFGPVITIDQVRLNNVKNLIVDNIGGRTVESDVQLISGYMQLAAMQPITYQANGTGGGVPTGEFTGSSLYIGGTAYTTFYATNTGWYRIMTPYPTGRGDMAGRVSITSPYARESIEMQVDSTQGGTPAITVSRCKTGTVIVSQARLTSYWDSTLGGEWSFLDIYVANALSPSSGQAGRLTVGLDVQGVQLTGSTMCQLLAPVIPVSTAVPSGASSVNTVTVNTYR